MNISAEIATVAVAGVVWILLWIPLPGAHRNKNPLFIAGDIPPFFRFVAILGGLLGAFLFFTGVQ